MKDSIRIFAISGTNLLASACFTIISSFYPSTAVRSGVPEELIGMIFSTFPLVSILTSFFVPSLMQSFNRSTVLITGLILISFSSILVSSLESFNAPQSIIISFASRAFSGIGAALETIAANSILMSDYPEKGQKVMALNEFLSTLGLILGPLIGSLIFSYGGFFVSCFSVGLFVLGYVPLLILVLGVQKKYRIETRERVSVLSLLTRPVITTQRITFHFSLGILITFALGVNMPTLQFHLNRYGIGEDLIGYWYLISTVAYLASSVVLGRMKIERYERVLFLGVSLYAVAYMMLGPCTHIFPQSLIFVGIGHHLIGWACSILYSISYAVPLIPFLIEIATKDYKILADDRLNDAVNVLVNISICFGEVIGPILGSIVPSYFEEEEKFKITYCMVALVFVVFGVLYIIFNYSKMKKDKNELEESLIDETNKSDSFTNFTDKTQIH